MTTAVIVQARLGSTRLPGKVLELLAGQSVLAHVLKRCQTIKNADFVVCAVPEGPADDPIALEVERCGCAVFRGSEQDVLARYHGAATNVGADWILRVTADCPLIDPKVCADVIDLAQAESAAYACNNNPPSWPHGLDCECVPFAWLDRAFHEAQKPFEREHVMPFIRNHSEAKLANLPCPEGDLTGHRWTLDEAADLAFMRAVFEDDVPPGGWDFRSTLRFLADRPDISALNAGVSTPSYHKAKKP
ncbi:MAG: cytidylyltransferase domain-containing protein [Rhodospirillales bacterium]